MELPVVNIMMPVYNGMPLLKASIESIKRQTYTAWQCIICDDGSTDGTWEYLQSLELSTPETLESRFVILRNEHNMGRGYTRQRILEACTAPYICMLDSGDLMHPERMARQVAYLESHLEIGLVSSAMISFGRHTDRLSFRGRGASSPIIYDGAHFPCFAPSMFRNPRNNGARFADDLNFVEDQYFLERYFHYQPQYYVLPEALYYYSEFESASKSRIRKSYIQNIQIYFRQRKWRVVLVNILKLIYSVLIFPFLSLETILLRRGRLATEDEGHEFQIYGRPLLQNV